MLASGTGTATALTATRDASPRDRKVEKRILTSREYRTLGLERVKWAVKAQNFLVKDSNEVRLGRRNRVGEKVMCRAFNGLYKPIAPCNAYSSTGLAFQTTGASVPANGDCH